MRETQFPLFYNVILRRISRQAKVIQTIKSVEVKEKNVGSIRITRFYKGCPRFSSALCQTEAFLTFVPFFILKTQLSVILSVLLTSITWKRVRNANYQSLLDSESETLGSVPATCYNKPKR